MSERIGLIAGNRKFPLIFSAAARKKGYSLVAVAVKGDTSRALNKLVDKIYWVSLAEYSRVFSIFKNEGVKKIVMAGQISPVRLFSGEIQKDPQLKELLSQIKDQRADTIFGAIVKKFNDEGFEFLDSTTFIEDYLPKKGILTGEPSAQILEDIHFGFDLAKQVAGLDIGQAVVIKNKAIVAVEALEGTDNLIKRAGCISRGGFTVVKVSKPRQDMRFDVPVIGLNTIKNLLRAKAACLAFEAGKTLFIDQEAGVDLARKKGLIIVAV
ncbi:MAG: hypothetical protein COV71_01220 [Candidatus Omnitrophica bacterium CG11_big_fil_rev_8_21_14_0_20_41_12]|nr:MAG: hypothetical protein COV71_01220 [Candidatus Omnitrophica bacterium CG11_big_fil_rev_8_21_14_0_20_41_12]